MAELRRRASPTDAEAGVDDADGDGAPNGGAHSGSRGGSAPAALSAGALFAQMTGSLSVSALISLVPGIVLSVYSATLLRVPGLMALVPPLIGMRGNVFGSLSSKLSTVVVSAPSALIANAHADGGVHSLPDMRARYYGALGEVLLLSFVLPVFSAAARAAMGEDLAPTSVSALICVLSGLLSGSVMLRFTQWVVVWSVRRGLDPDNVSAPLITTLGDLITIPCVIAALHVTFALPEAARIAVLLLLFGGLVYLFWASAALIPRAAFRQLLLERLPVLLVCMSVSFVAGIALELLIAALSRTDAVRGAQNALLLALSPLFNAQGGSGGSVFASRISTYCALAGIGAGTSATADADGTDTGSGSGKGLPLVPPRSMQRDAAVLSAAVGSIMCVVGGAMAVYGFSARLLVPLVLGMTLLLSASSAIAYYATALCVAQRWEADNIGIPVVCATMDFVASWGYVAILMAVYV